MYINWYTRIIFFDDLICYRKKSGVRKILQFSQRNVKLPLPQQKQGNYPVINIYGCNPNPLQVQTILLPPPMVHMHPRVPICLQEQTRDGSRREKLCDGVLKAGDVYLHLPQTRFYHRRHQWGVGQTPVLLPPCQLAYNPVVKSTQSNTNEWRNHSHL